MKRELDARTLRWCARLCRREQRMLESAASNNKAAGLSSVTYDARSDTAYTMADIILDKARAIDTKRKPATKAKKGRRG